MCLIRSCQLQSRKHWALGRSRQCQLLALGSDCQGQRGQHWQGSINNMGRRLEMKRMVYDAVIVEKAALYKAWLAAVHAHRMWCGVLWFTTKPLVLAMLLFCVKFASTSGLKTSLFDLPTCSHVSISMMPRPQAQIWGNRLTSKVDSTRKPLPSSPHLWLVELSTRELFFVTLMAMW